jgi:hypothetical protein
MNIPKIHPAVYVFGGLAVAYGIWYVIDKIMNPNKGTPFEGKGAIGTFAHATDAALGGAPSSLGSTIGLALYDLTHKDYANAVTYTFTFRDGPNAGKFGAVNSDEVDADTGVFAYFRDGAKYRLKKDSAGKYYATKV